MTVGWIWSFKIITTDVRRQRLETHIGNWYNMAAFRRGLHLSHVGFGRHVQPTDILTECTNNYCRTGLRIATERPVWAAFLSSFDLHGLRQTGPNIATESSVKAISFGFLFSLTQDPRLCFCVPLSPLSPWQFITCNSDYHFNYRVACHNPDSAR